MRDPFIDKIMKHEVELLNSRLAMATTIVGVGVVMLFAFLCGFLIVVPR